MIFNSVDFAIFFAVFFLLYWFVFNRSLKIQNVLILAGSYAFYAWGDWRFLPLLIFGSGVNYALGIGLERSARPKIRLLLLWLGLLQGLGGLIYFKYTNFFLASITGAFSFFHIPLRAHPVRLILPLGISFYTFRTLSYLLDIYKGKFKATTDWVAFFSYVSFFPSLISGPIDRPKTLIPQLQKRRVFDSDQAIDGMRQILWGLFKKAVIADNCATFTSQIFGNYQGQSASTLLLGAFLYTIQIYADFSGYSDMAIGTARLLGFSITKNFDFPFFSQNIAEYWRKWHISLTSWLTEYVFTPLSIAFRDYGKRGIILAILINFTLIGMWHGANWTFVLFGFLHGCYFIPLILRGTMSKRKEIARDNLLPSLREFSNMLGTFILVMLTLILFRSDSILDAYRYFKGLFSLSLFSIPALALEFKAGYTLFFIFLMLLTEWLNRGREYAISHLGLRWPIAFRWTAYYALLVIIFVFAGSSRNFIYFQF